jgi:hypothetical protein
MDFIFTPTVSAELDTTYSASVTIADQASPLEITLSPVGYSDTMLSPTIRKNNVITTSPFLAINGDVITVSGTSNNTNNSASFVTVKFGDKALSVFGIITEALQTSGSPDNSTLSNPLFMLDYTPVSPNNRILELNAETAALTNTYSLTDPAGAGPLGDGLPYILASDHPEDKVRRVSESGQTVQVLNIPKPFSIARTPTLSPASDTVSRAIVCDPLNDRVRIINGATFAVEHVVDVGAGPYYAVGLPTTDPNTYSFWVSCRDSDRVERWLFNGTSVVLDLAVTLTPGSGPSGIEADSFGNAYVVCTTSKQVAIVYADGVTATQYRTFGISPIGFGLPQVPLSIVKMPYGNYDFFYIFDYGSSGTCWRLTTPGLACHAFVGPWQVDRLLTVGSNLYAGSTRNGILTKYLLVEDGNATSFPSGPTVVVLTETKQIEGLSASVDGSKVYVLVQHEDAPSTGNMDLTPNSLYDYIINNASAGVRVTSNPQMISGITDSNSTVLHVHGILSTSFVKNGVDSNLAQVSVQNNDIIALSATAPDPFLSVFTPVLYDGGFAMFNIFMLSVARIRVAGYMRGG